MNKKSFVTICVPDDTTIIINTEHVTDILCNRANLVFKIVYVNKQYTTITVETDEYYLVVYKQIKRLFR